MLRLPVAVLALLLGASTACARPEPGAVRPGPVPSATLPMPSSTRPGTNLVPDGYQGRFRTAGTVLEDRKHGPQLCYAMAQSHPPQCAGLDIDGWSWQQVAHETARGSSWGQYQLIGTYDGKRFRLTEPARTLDPNAVPNQAPDMDFTSPCPPPTGGWAVVDRDTATVAAFDAAMARAARRPGFAGAWIDQNGATGHDVNHPARIVLNVRYTDDLAAHERDLRRVWGGALCVAKAEHTLAALERIAAEESADRSRVLGGSVDVTTNTVWLTVYAAQLAWQRELDQRYGPGVVQLYGAFQPIG